MRHLRPRVDARVGSPSALDFHRASKNSSAALRSWPCTVRALFCSCQPLYFVPSYSMVSFQVFSTQGLQLTSVAPCSRSGML